jgi:hypothetical protein
MPSKGITVYSYISVEGYEVEFSVPKQTVMNTFADNFTAKKLEVELSNFQSTELHRTIRMEDSSQWQRGWKCLQHDQ